MGPCASKRGGVRRVLGHLGTARLISGVGAVRAAATARRLLRADAVFEVCLGVPLLVAGATGRDRALQLPPPASSPLVAAFGAGLLPFAAVLWRESVRPTSGRLQGLATVNGLTATVLAGWLAARRRETGTLGAVATGAPPPCSAALAAAQARVASRLR